MAELERIVALPEAQRAAWLKAQNAKALGDVFTKEEFVAGCKQYVDVEKSFRITMEEFWAGALY